jgi:4'-phosphopantetheinyl transferase
MSGLPDNHEALANASYSFVHRCSSPVRDAQLWWVDHGVELTSVPFDILSREEIAKAQVYRFEADRRSFMLRRTALRLLIGRHLNCDPSAIRFACTAYGKPSLAWPRPTPGLCFSVARTTEATILTIAECNSIGIDIERVRHDLDFARIGPLVFAESELAWLKECDRDGLPDRFFRLWTRKEAYLKALGWGFLRDPRLFSTTAAFDSQQWDEEKGFATHAGAPDHDVLLDLPLGDAVRGAIAIAGRLSVH